MPSIATGLPSGLYQGGTGDNYIINLHHLFRGAAICRYTELQPVINRFFRRQILSVLFDDFYTVLPNFGQSGPFTAPTWHPIAPQRGGQKN